MYIYDFDCYMWCYDVGGFVWDNFEFFIDFWLWFYFLCIGWVDVFCFVEVMICYMGEVDVYYIGWFVLFGLCYNVLYWGCSVKQLCISIVVNWCYYYYLMGDECVGEFMCEQFEVVCMFVKIFLM